MKKFEIAYIPIGVPTYHLESAGAEFERSKKLLSSLCDNLKAPEEMLLTIDKLSDFLKDIEPDLIIIQNVTFANAAYASEVLSRFKESPILLWTLREPVIDGGRLRLNSLTGAYSAANAIKNFRKEPFTYVFGAADEKNVKEKISAAISAARIKHDMKELTMAAIGHTPQGFGFGRALDLELLNNFGVSLLSVEARELIEKARSYTPEECESYLKDAGSRMVGLQDTPENNRIDFSRLYRAYDEFVKENNIGAIASRCWPDYFTSFGTPVCAVLSMLNDLNIPSSCEADCYGALSMYIGSSLTGKPTFFGDPVSMDEKENTITFWHCGTGACSLARKDTGAVTGEHCNRHIGPTLEFGCEAAPEATIFRIGRKPDGKFRFFIAEGEALDKPKQFFGTSVVVKTNDSAKDIVFKTIEEGFEPHFVVIFKDVKEELSILSDMFGMEKLVF